MENSHYPCLGGICLQRGHKLVRLFVYLLLSDLTRHLALCVFKYIHRGIYICRHLFLLLKKGGLTAFFHMDLHLIRLLGLQRQLFVFIHGFLLWMSRSFHRFGYYILKVLFILFVLLAFFLFRLRLYIKLRQLFRINIHIVVLYVIGHALSLLKLSFLLFLFKIPCKVHLCV